MAQTVNIPREATMVRMAEAVEGLVAQLRVANHRDADIGSMAQVRDIVRAGLADEYFSIGDQIVVPWTDPDSSTLYQVPFDVVSFGDAVVEGEDEPRRAMWLQSHFCFPQYLEFDARESFYTADGCLTAGTYHLTIGDSYGKLVAGTSYQFTLSQDVPEGGCLCGFYSCYDTDPVSSHVYSYASQSSTSAIEMVDISVGSDGSDLGTYSKAAGEALNSYQRASYGSNRWSQSALRQYLNATGTDWWSPQTRYDRPPSYAGKSGFAGGFGADFLEVLGRVRLLTALNTVCDGGTHGGSEADVTHDVFFLPSGEQHYMQVNDTFGSVAGLEGAYWEYWKRTLGTGSPGVWYQTYPQWITRQLGSTAARHCWMRSCYRGYADGVAYVSASGTVGDSYAYNTRGAAPACAIC